ncbi:MAG: RNA polymerase sigma factor [Berkelbacteria bacterium GW2011_GWA2_35_9]|uniref:RNA polymerase sigma factor n=1 Tax=Berkelbacteria bacterium GW2011_GWA2_35_9 TaxID=1618333 RepID=A0A0G0D7E0_9BACT|nr:MAG: RNA polymerase sigma factor [Berkelbacteria bacterium GW2011_GWA2_35_9]
MPSVLYFYSSSEATLSYEQQLNYHEKYLETGDIKFLHIIANSLRKFITFRAKKLTDNPDDLLDLIEEGYLLTIKALKRYKKNKGMITTFVCTAIDRGLKRYINNNCKNFVIPEKFLRYILIACHIQDFSMVSENHHLSDEEIADRLMISIEAYQYAKKLYSITPILSLEEIISFQHFYTSTHDGLPPNYQDVLPCVDYDVENLTTNQYYDKVDKLLNNTTKKQREAIIIRYGLEDGQFKTLEKTAEILGCNRQNVDALIKNGIKRIRNNIPNLDTQRQI